MHFKKKRKPGPSKNVKKVQRRETDGPVGATLRQIHPTISNITIQISITSPQKALVLEETRTIPPNAPADFACACPGTCGIGVFRFNEKISTMVERQEASAEISGACPEEGFGGIPQPCAYAITCRIDISY